VVGDLPAPADGSAADARSRRTPVAELEVEVASARESRSVMKGENVDLTVEVAPVGGASAQGVEVLVNGERALISGDPTYPDSVTVTGDLQLTDEQRAALAQWGRLLYPLAAVVEATRQSWGCGACLVLASAAVVACAACVGGNLAACGPPSASMPSRRPTARAPTRRIRIESPSAGWPAYR
jgi:hypothetical protein